MKRFIISSLIVLGVWHAAYAQTLPPGVGQLLEKSRRLLQEFDQDLPLDSARTKPVVDLSMALPRIIPVIFHKFRKLCIVSAHLFSELLFVLLCKSKLVVKTERC